MGFYEMNGYNYDYHRKAALPEGVEHGTYKALRYGCTCDACAEKARRRRMRRNGVRRERDV